MRIPSPKTVLNAGVHIVAETVRPLVRKYRLDHAPSLERTIVAVGPRGAFAEVAETLRPVWKDRIRDAEFGILSGAFNMDPAFRLNILPEGEVDVLVYAPTNFGERNVGPVFDFLDEIYDRVASEARHAVLVEYGSHASLDAPITVLRSDGEASPADPAVGLTVAKWCGHEEPNIFEMSRQGRFGDGGVLDHAFGPGAILFAMRPTGDEAATSLAKVVADYSVRATVVRQVSETPRDVVVIALGEGRAFNAAGDEVAFDRGPAPRI